MNSVNDMEVNSIEKFEELIKEKPIFYILRKYNICEAVLEYYINNYDDIHWNIISISHRLSDTFIDKYADKLDWFRIMHNEHISKTYYFMEKHLYRYNLYHIKTFVLNSSLYSDILDDLRKKYPSKFEIDKIAHIIR